MEALILSHNSVRFCWFASLAVAVVGFYQMWRAEQLGSPAKDLSVAILLFLVDCCSRNDLVSDAFAS